MPVDRRLLVHLAKNGLMGIAMGWLLLAALIYANVGNLRFLLLDADVEITAILLLAAGFAVTFGSLAMGTAVFLLPRD